MNRSRERARGRADQEARAQLRPLVHSGRAVCWRCGQVIVPDLSVRGEGWDAGHVESLGEGGHPHGKRVPEHASCNRGAGGQLAAELARGRRVNRSRFLG